MATQCWDCDCGTTNAGTARTCENCGKRHTVPDPFRWFGIIAVLLIVCVMLPWPLAAVIVGLGLLIWIGISLEKLVNRP